MASVPSHIQQRVAVWDELAAKAQVELKAKQAEEKTINVTLPDGKVVEGKAFTTTPLDIALGISKGLAQNCVVAKVDGKTFDMRRPLEGDCALELCKFDTPEGEYTFWHSSAHVLGQAIEMNFEDSRLCIGPPVDDGGFYYDVFLPDKGSISHDDLEKLDKSISKIQKEKQPFERLVLTKAEANRMFAQNKFKLEIINNKVPDGESCTAYRCGPLIDLCRGPHIQTTGKIKAMSCTKNSSAYWLANSDNATLQRVYGISFPDKKKLKEYRKQIKLAEERDHRLIGKAQELFFFDAISPGSCFFMPHGTRLYNRLISFIRGQYRERGYEEVVTPNVFNVDLWKSSGHYANYKDNMFLFQVEGEEFGMKPMNCPGHCIMFKHRLRSYRELPIRMADFGVLHRNELSGALTGLTRVRRFQQDDAHIFCRHDQIQAEVRGVLDMLAFVYKCFGFTFSLKLSTRPEKYLGELHLWDNAEQSLAQCLDDFGLPWNVDPGDGAFYGPKIDIQLHDALKRKHQCATIQLDFQLPIRFDLKYKTDQGGEFQRPVMVHRAILGSVERMTAVLIEHTGGIWPFWLNPRQCIVVPVDLKFSDYAEKVHQKLLANDYYSDFDNSTLKFSKKVALAQKKAKAYNFILIIGANEVENNTVTVRDRDDPKNQVTCSVEELLERFAKLTAEYA